MLPKYWLRRRHWDDRLTRPPQCSSRDRNRGASTMKSVIVTVALLALTGSVQARDIKAEIDSANAKFVAAFNKGDGAGVAQFYTDRAVALPPGAPMAKGRTAIQGFWQGAIQAGY